MIDRPLGSFNRQSAAEQLSRYRCYDRTRGAGRSLAGALHQGSHVLQKFCFFFFSSLQGPPGRWSLLQPPSPSAFWRRWRAYSGLPGLYFIFPSCSKKKKKPIMSTPADFSSLLRRISIFYLHQYMLPYGLCLLFSFPRWFGVQYSHGDLLENPFLNLPKLPVWRSLCFQFSFFFFRSPRWSRSTVAIADMQSQSEALRLGLISIKEAQDQRWT